MTRADLSTLLREDVAGTEPSWSPDPAVATGLGRRRLRRRRATVLGAVTAVVVVAGLGGGAAWHRADVARHRSASPVVGEPIDQPAELDQLARSVLGRTVPDLGPATYDDVPNRQQVAPGSPPAMSVSYEVGDLRFWVRAAQAKSEAEGDPEQYCHGGVAGGLYRACTIDHDAAGDPVIITVARAAEWLHELVLTGTRKSVDPVTHRPFTADEIWWLRTVKVIRSSTLVVSVQEAVHAPTEARAEPLFVTPTDDLVELATDPAITADQATLSSGAATRRHRHRGTS